MRYATLLLRQSAKVTSFYHSDIEHFYLMLLRASFKNIHDNKQVECTGTILKVHITSHKQSTYTVEYCMWYDVSPKNKTFKKWVKSQKCHDRPGPCNDTHTLWNNNFASSLHVTHGSNSLGYSVRQTVYELWGMSDGAMKAWWNILLGVNRK